MRNVALLLLLLPLAAPAQDVTCARPEPVALVNPTVLTGTATTAQLQAALDAGGHIRIDAASPATIALTAELVITKAVVLDGGGNVTLSGGNARRVFRITNPANAFYGITLQRITIADGNSTAAAGTEFDKSGAGILKVSGGPWQAVSLTAIDCTFRDGVAVATAQDGGGGAMYLVGLDSVTINRCTFQNNRGSNGGAVYSLGSRVVSIADSQFTSNLATGTSGNPGNGGNAGALGVDGAARTVNVCGTRFANNTGNAFGGGFFSVMYDAQSFTGFRDSTFDTNAINAGFGHSAGAYIQGGPFAIQSSTFKGNVADGFGGLFVGPGATGTIVNSTFSGNIARTGLGAALAISNPTTVSITNTTIASNVATAAFAAGISVGSGANGLRLQNVVLANNTGGNRFVSWGINNAAQFDGGGNIQFPQTRPMGGGTEVMMTPTSIFADPLLAALANNGGPTETMALGAGSPAIDTGVANGAPPADQRGVPRCGPVDRGSFEALSPQTIYCNGFE